MELLGSTCWLYPQVIRCSRPCALVGPLPALAVPFGWSAVCATKPSGTHSRNSVVVPLLFAIAGTTTRSPRSTPAWWHVTLAMPSTPSLIRLRLTAAGTYGDFCTDYTPTENFAIMTLPSPGMRCRPVRTEKCLRKLRPAGIPAMIPPSCSVGLTALISGSPEASLCIITSILRPETFVNFARPSHCRLWITSARARRLDAWLLAVTWPFSRQLNSYETMPRASIVPRFVLAEGIISCAAVAASQ